MSSSTTQSISILLVACGVGLCATFGAQLTPQTLTTITTELSVQSKSEESEQTAKEVEEPLARVSSWWSGASLPFSGGLLLIFAGSFMARSAKRAAFASSTDQSEVNQSNDVSASLTEVISRLEELMREERALPDIKRSIEEIQLECLEPLIEGRERIRVQLGTANFIDVFGPIAQGERKLNRAWAACVDQHRGEAESSILSALEAFRSSLSLRS